jgi:hypothetical protein
MKDFGVFVDFASSAVNQATTLCFESTVHRVPVSGETIGCQARQHLFGGVFFINGEQLVVRSLLLWFCTGSITGATQVN